RIALVIVVDELDRASEQTAFGVRLVFPDLHPEQCLLAIGGERASQRHAEANLDRLLVLRRGRNHEHRAGRDGKYRPREPCGCPGLKLLQHVFSSHELRFISMADNDSARCNGPPARGCEWLKNHAIGCASLPRPRAFAVGKSGKGYCRAFSYG